MPNYKAIAIGLHKRILVEESQVVNELQKLYAKDYNKDYYVSVYNYDEAAKRQFEETKSLAGISGLKTSSLIFDFDSKKNLDEAKKDTITLSDRLLKAGFSKDKMQVYFSGNKGLHIQVDLNQEYTKPEVDALFHQFASDLPTADKQIHDYQRIMRAPLSRHQGSGLYKIPLTVDELNTSSIEQIKIQAQNPDDSRYELADRFTSDCRQDLPIPIPAFKKETKKEVVVNEDGPDFAKNKTGLTNAKYALASGYFEEGERHEAVMILASTYKALGWPFENAFENVKASIRQRNARLEVGEITDPEKAELWHEVNSVYGENWKGGTYNEDGNSLLIKTKQRYGINDKFKENTVINIAELRVATEHFLKDLKNNRIYTGLNDLDKNLILTKGMMFGALGSPGSGKTSFLNLFMKNTSKNHGPCLYMSADMSKDLLGTKIIQNYTGYSIDKLEDMMLHKTYDKKYKDAVELFLEDYKNVGFCFENGYSVQDVSDEIKRFEDKVGNRVSLVGVDYLEKIIGPYSEETANSGYVAANLANIAKKHDTCIGLLLQPSKISGSPADEFKSYRSIKGASKIEQDARAIIGIWRPGYSPEEYMRDRYMSISILKQNMGKLGRFDYNWEGATGNISEMNDEQRRLFKQFLEELANLKNEDDGLL